MGVLSRTGVVAVATVAAVAGSLLGGVPAHAAVSEPVVLAEGVTESPEELSIIDGAADVLVYSRPGSDRGWLHRSGQPDVELPPEFPPYAYGSALQGGILSVLGSTTLPSPPTTPGAPGSPGTYGPNQITYVTLGDAAARSVVLAATDRYLGRTPVGYLAERLTDVSTGARTVVHVTFQATETSLYTLPAGSTALQASAGDVGAVIQTGGSTGTGPFGYAAVYVRYDGAGGAGSLDFPGDRYPMCADQLTRQFLFCVEQDGPDSRTVLRVPLDGGAPSRVPTDAYGIDAVDQTAVAWVSYGADAQGADITVWRDDRDTPATLVHGGAAGGWVDVGPAGNGWYVTVGGPLGEAGVGRIPLDGGQPTLVVTAEVAPLQARTLAVSAGVVSWIDNRSHDGSLWQRSLTSGATGPEVGAAQLITTGASGYSLAVSGDRVAYEPLDPSAGDVVRDGDRSTPVGARTQVVALSGDRALLYGAVSPDPDAGYSYLLRHLPTGDTTPLPGEGYDLWGERLVGLAADGSVSLTDLRTGTSQELRPADTAGMTSGSVHVAGDTVSWDLMGYEPGEPEGPYVPGTQEVAIRDLETGTTTVLDDMSFVSDLSTGYLVGTHCVDEFSADCRAVVRDLASGEVTDLGYAGYGVVVDGNTLAYISGDGDTAGLPVVASLPAYADEPRLLAAPGAPATFRAGTPWSMRVVASRVLTECAVRIEDSAGAVVRSLDCRDPHAATTVSWDGEDATGRAVAAGRYSWTITGRTGDDALVDYDGTASALSGSVQVGGVTTPPVVEFGDVPQGHQFAPDISWLVSRNITTGYADGGFKPANPVSRQAMAAFLYRFAGEPEFTPPSTPTFVDRGTADAFFTEVEWLAGRGVTTGTDLGDGRKGYNPGGPVSRQAMAAFLYRFAGEPEFDAPTTPSFTDVPRASAFYREVEWLASTGVTTGTDLGSGLRSFRPADPVSRQAMAAFLHRFDGLG